MRRPVPRKAPRGLFIVLEGLDGAGTTTQMERLAAALRAAGHPVLTTCEPSNGPVGALIRQALRRRLVLPDARGALSHQTLALLFAADRVDHLEAEIEPALARGEHVICDRYVLSSLAYQGAHAESGWVATLNLHAVSPDLTLFIEVRPEVAQQRRARRGSQEELYESEDKQRRIAQQYLAAIAARPGDRLVRIDGSAGIAQVTRAALRHLRPLLAERTHG